MWGLILTPNLIEVFRILRQKMLSEKIDTAKSENESGINGSYYFRIVPKSYNESIIKEIAESGHEIGYHYEDLPLAKGNIDKAYDSFYRNLEVFRKLYPVKTICMLMRFVFLRTK